jgi:outer membrane protein assembly complex protein YaeT
VVWLLAGLAGAQTQAPAPNYLGKHVTKIQFRATAGQLTPDEQARFLRVLPIKPGDVLSRTKLRDSLQALYPTRRFSEIQVEATPDGDGVALTFVVRPNYFVGAIIVEGAPRPPSENQLVNATKFELGKAFAESEMPEAVDRMKSVMADNGYHEAEITPSYQYHEESFLVDITFAIESGPHARVGAVEVRGDAGYPAAKILDIAKMHSGDGVTSARITRALQRLRKRYQKDNRLEAQVSIREGAYHEDTQRLDYTFHIERGPRVDIAVEGANIRRGLLKKYVPIFEENAVDDDLLNEGRRNLRDYLQTKGYFDANVEFDYRENSEEDRTAIVFDIDRGERHKFDKLEINGNKYFDATTLRERMRIEPASLLLFYGRFSPTLLTRDVQSIENLYRANGFQQVKVASDVRDDVNGKSGLMHVIINIEEGPQTLVSKLNLEGNTHVSEEKIRSMVDTQEGQPYSEVNIAKDRDTVTNYYFNLGFPDMKFEYTTRPADAGPNQMNVSYRVVEGEQRFVNKVIVNGLQNTRNFVVDRELRVHSGDPLDQSAMIDTQRRLYDLGIFNEANIAVQNPDGSLTSKNVIVNVEEAKRYTFSYGVGLEVQTGDLYDTCQGLPNPAACQPQGRAGVSPRVSFDVTRLNFLGRNHTVVFKSRLGRLQQRALVTYEAPHWFNRENMTLTFTAFFDKTQDVRTFTAERLEGSAQINHILNKATQLLYVLTYRRIQVDPKTLQVDPVLIPLYSQPVRIGFPSLTYIRDTRDDPIESHRGTYTTSTFSVASSIFGSESNFARLFMQNSTYHRPFKNKSWVLARSTRVGVEAPFGSATYSFVPLPELYFSGGGNSHRGYAINQAGPRDLQTGFPLGGEALFINNLELRSPPIALPFLGENLSTVIFHDAGNVFASAEDMVKNLWRFKQPDPLSCKQLTRCDFRFVSHAVGFGLRYKTPIGPVRVDMGYSLTPTVFPIQNQARSETLQRLNFYFSIGQTF